MNNLENEPADHPRAHRLREALGHRFSLLADKAGDDEIERRIRDGVELAGATPWILMFAILVASIGLNVNSAAVIIGAMLISPLMGPIMGTGLGIAVYDVALVRRSALNLGIATIISLIVSTLYFSISPLHEAQSELLSRTTPTIWDVLIALFGGLAGIVGITRQERSHVIPGMAIATALMPPVCTAGFGIATGRWAFVGGAMYLYTINCVFIALATVIGIRVLRLRKRGFADHRVERRVKAALLVIALGTALPSGYLAAVLVKQEVFKNAAQQFVTQQFAFEKTQVAELTINPAKRTIELVLVGEPLAPSAVRAIELRLAPSGLDGAHVIVHQGVENRVDMAALKTSLMSDLYRRSEEAAREKDDRITHLQQELGKRNEILAQAQAISDELRAQYPEIALVFISDGLQFQVGESARPMLMMNVTSNGRLSPGDRSRIENWFKVRTRNMSVIVNFSDVTDTVDRARRVGTVGKSR